VNIYVLDTDIDACARFHCDRHVVKMVLESAQMLCTVLFEQGVDAPYRPTHRRHPCTLWAGRSLSNWLWLRELGLALNREFRYRFEKDRDHASTIVIRGLPRPPIPDLGLTEFAQAMPEKYRVPGSAVRAYRAFYVAEKGHFARWTRRPEPGWFVRGTGGRG
jgi:hypothetical protein